MAQAVSRWPLTQEALTRSQASPRDTRAYFFDPLLHADRILREILKKKSALLFTFYRYDCKSKEIKQTSYISAKVKTVPASVSRIPNRVL